MRKVLNTVFVGVSVFGYASIYYLGSANIQQAHAVTSLQMWKPFVYRQLMPLLARCLEWIGVRIDIAVTLLMVAFGIGAYLAIIKLADVFYPADNRSELWLTVCFIVTLPVLGLFRQPYDMATACLFAWSLYYLASGQATKYLLLFPLVCLNRETAILLTVFCVVRSIQSRQWDWDFDFIGYQVWAWVAVMVILRSVFADNVGSEAWIEPLENLHKFIADPLRTVTHLTALMVILYFVFRHWGGKPIFLRLAFVTFALLLFPAYLVMGQAYEVRIFWEIVPITAVLVVK